MKKASRQVEPYPPELRAEAIRLARTSGKPHAQFAQDLGMTSETWLVWLVARPRDGATSFRWLVGHASPGQTWSLGDLSAQVKQCH